jgi:FtsH-binding integral membrane protein
MPPDSFRELLRLAVILFLLMLPAAQWAAFREMARRGTHDQLRESRNVRDHTLAALGRAAQVGLALQVPAMIAWAVAAWSRLHWDVLVGAEILLAFVVLAVGLTAAALRFALDLMARVGAARASRALLGLRLFTLGAGLTYGAVLWFVLPGGAGETLLSVFTLGAALAALGLNRTAEMSPELMRRLAQATRRR